VGLSRENDIKARDAVLEIARMAIDGFKGRQSPLGRPVIVKATNF
jgi:hypothetical protein